MSITASTAFLVSIISLTWTLFLSFRLLYWVYWKRLSWIARMGGSRHTSIFLEALRNSLQREQYPWGAGGSKRGKARWSTRRTCEVNTAANITNCCII